MTTWFGWIAGLAAVIVLAFALDLPMTLSPLLNSPPRPSGRAAEVLAQPPIISEVSTLGEIEPSLKQLQNRRARAGRPELLTPGEPSADSGLNRWDRIDRTALRHTSGLDYFLGFGY
jgi:hypothetical protein